MSVSPSQSNDLTRFRIYEIYNKMKKNNKNLNTSILSDKSKRILLNIRFEANDRYDYLRWDMGHSFDMVCSSLIQTGYNNNLVKKEDLKLKNLYDMILILNNIQRNEIINIFEILRCFMLYCSSDLYNEYWDKNKREYVFYIFDEIEKSI